MNPYHIYEYYHRILRCAHPIFKQFLRTVEHEVVLPRLETAYIRNGLDLKSFIEWGNTNESLYPDVILTLKGLPASKLKASFIPRIVNFFNKCKKTTELKELSSRWAKEKPSLAKVIKAEIK